ncbi:hypothetical protein [Chromobacterium phragmitis]|uniref:Uncharacterized protein n=1 Tax=Chromobacterium phragmitis TaxID=2202141 RepID=A0ABV0J0H8_9NEIS
MSLSEVFSSVSVVIAIASFFTAIYQAKATREHNSLSTRPLLDCSTLIPQTGALQIILHNHGLGPAIIEGVYINYKGRTYSQNIKSEAAALTNLLYKDNEYHIGITTISAPSPIRADGEITLFSFTQPLDGEKNHFLEEKQLDSISNLGVIVKYKSIYNEKFELQYKPTND